MLSLYGEFVNLVFWHSPLGGNSLHRLLAVHARLDEGGKMFLRAHGKQRVFLLRAFDDQHDFPPLLTGKGKQRALLHALVDFRHLAHGVHLPVAEDSSELRRKLFYIVRRDIHDDGQTRFRRLLHRLPARARLLGQKSEKDKARAPDARKRDCRRHRAGPGDAFDSYPFPCTLTLVYTLTAGGLKLTYTVQNEGGETLPYGFAIHPYFDKMGQPDKIRIQVPAPSYYEAEMCMPTGKLLPAQNETDISEFKAVADLNLDHVFSGMSGKKACIAYDELGFGLELSASKEFVNMVVYTPQNRPGFCLENQTNATDFLNLYAKGIDTAFMNTVEPGQTASGWIEIKVV